MATPDDNPTLAEMTATAQAALHHWSNDFSDPVLIKFRENAIFSLTDQNGSRAAMRVHRHGYHSDSELRSELRWMRELGDESFHVPIAQPTKDGALFASVKAPTSTTVYQVDVLSWLDGEPIGSIETGLPGSVADIAALYRDVGDLIARLHNHAAERPVSDELTRHAWDAPGLIGAAPYWGDFRRLPALAPHMALIATACREADRDLSDIGQGRDGYGLIHADLLPENILRSGTRLMLIDFDDAGFGWFAFDLATALFWFTDHPHYDAIRDALETSYFARRPSGQAAWQHLELFFFLRSLTYLGWVTTRSETETARELEPLMVEKAVTAATNYLTRREARMSRPDRRG